MKIAIASDHAGYHLKEALRTRLIAQGHQVQDFGTNSTDSTDYPDYAALVGHQVANRSVDRGILVCYSGVGMSIAANKIQGVRAALGVNPDEVRLTRAHNDANILTLGASFTEQTKAEEFIDIFLNTEFDGGRHARRVAKIAQIEQQEAHKEQ